MYIFFIIGLLFVGFGIATLFWVDSFGLFFIIFIILGSSFLVMLIFLLFIITRSIDSVDAVTNQQYPENLDFLNIDHDALLVVHSMGIHGIGQYSGIDNLINHFIGEDLPFKIYHCYNPEDIISALRYQHAKYVWIFAHGWRGGVVFKWGGGNNIGALFKPKSTILTYESLVNLCPPLPKKRFIAQLHCNDISKKSPEKTTLPAILIDNPREQDYYVTEGSLNHYAIWFATREVVLKIQRNPIIDTETDKRED